VNVHNSLEIVGLRDRVTLNLFATIAKACTNLVDKINKEIAEL